MILDIHAISQVYASITFPEKISWYLPLQYTRYMPNLPTKRCKRVWPGFQVQVPDDRPSQGALHWHCRTGSAPGLAAPARRLSGISDWQANRQSPSRRNGDGRSRAGSTAAAWSRLIWVSSKSVGAAGVQVAFKLAAYNSSWSGRSKFTNLKVGTE